MCKCVQTPCWTPPGTLKCYSAVVVTNGTNMWEKSKIKIIWYHTEVRKIHISMIKCPYTQIPLQINFLVIELRKGKWMEIKFSTLTDQPAET